MKYMGSKRAMLRNGLGELLGEQVPNKSGFYDLFCGTASVAAHVAQNFRIPTYASDLQKYAVVLAASQIEKTQTFDALPVKKEWTAQTNEWLRNFEAQWLLAKKLSALPSDLNSMREAVITARSFCANLPSEFAFAKAYGGHYYSPTQGMLLDAMRANLPQKWSEVALASLIDSASSCAAAPGHTAQPFSTSNTALPHLAVAWAKDLLAKTCSALERLSTLNASVAGEAVLSDATTFSKRLNENDLAFIDPPYSEVQYSRFYHVLESVAQGEIGEVAGVGRYPPIEKRPQSMFCRLSQSEKAFNDLMRNVSNSGAQAIVTFPAGQASNGMSGLLVEAISDKYFQIAKRKITSQFSTLGGNAISRNARKTTTELVLHLVPK